MKFVPVLLSLLPGLLSSPPPAEGQETDPQALKIVLDSAGMEMAKGRFWHAAQRLHAAYPGGGGFGEDLLFLFATAESGWRNWEGVIGLLEEPLETAVVDRVELWHRLGRAYEGVQRWEDAERAYERALAPIPIEDSGLISQILARRAMVRGRLEKFRDALGDLRALESARPFLADWVAVALAEESASAGAREETRLALSSVGDPSVRRLGWDLLPRALLASGDSTGAEAAYWSSLLSLDATSDRLTAWDRVAVLRLARGDSVGARGAFHQVLSLSASGPVGLRAAEAVMELGADSVNVALAAARALAGAGRHAEALKALDLMEELSPGPLPPGVLLFRGRSFLSAGQTSRALAVAETLGVSEDPEIGAPALSLRADVLRRSGLGGEARAAEDELVLRFPNRTEAAEILFSRAEALQNQGDRTGAVLGYLRTVELAPSHDLAGQARMRVAQLHLGAGEEAEALEVYSDYLRDFPDGRRWDEAAFWSGRLLRASGREEEARDLLVRLRESYPLSYYAVRAGDLLGEAYDPPIPEIGDSLPFPAFLRDGLMRFDALLEAGLRRGALWEAESLAARLRTDPDAERRFGALLRLALELNARGFTREGINLGWELRREGRGWDRTLLSAVYPFPYRDIVLAEAGERRADPFLIAGLIRQESAFWAEALSRADARGLMQVLPATGRELARSAGVVGFKPDDHLYEPEINVHLGVAFFVEMRRRFGEDLPIILSAYNAGPSRATRWRQYPEAKDMDRFVERIPFVETRGYVKNVTANQAIYAWLYGDDVEAPEGGTPGPVPLP